MTVKMRRNFSGAFTAQALGQGAWRLTQRQPNEVTIFLRGVDGVDAQAFSAERLTDLGIEWNDGRALLTLKCNAGVASAAASAAWVHEPQPELYRGLPLAQFDAKARRFWGRVFWLVRMPGGRRLLKYLARGGRKRG